MTAIARTHSESRPALARLEPERVALSALGVLIVATGLLVYHLTRGSSFGADEWLWILHRRGDSVGTFLAPYNGHLSIVPIAIYRLMFAVFGIGSYTPYLVMLLLGTSVSALVVFEYVRRRLGAVFAVMVAALILFVAPGWQDIMWPFQVAWVLAAAAGILTLSLLERHTMRADVAACCLTTIAVCCTSVGVAFAVGAAVELALTRRSPRDLWIVAVPLIPYGIWTAHYHPTSIQWSAVTAAPLNFAETTSASLSGLVGLSGVTALDSIALSFTFGAPLLALATIAAVVRLARGWRSTRALSLLTVLIVFSLMATLTRYFQSPVTARYMYIHCLVVALLMVELAVGVRFTRRSQAVIGVLTAAAVVSNYGTLRDGGSSVQAQGAGTDAALAAVDLDRGTVATDTPLTAVPYNAFMHLTAGSYYAIVDALGSPAYTLRQLQRASNGARGVADAQLVDDGDVRLTAPSPPPTGAAPIAPAVTATSLGTVARSARCVTFQPTAAVPEGQSSGATLTVAPGRLRLTAGPSPVTLSVRRFASTFTGLGSVAAAHTADFDVRRDRVGQPWYLQLQTAGPVRACAEPEPAR